MRKHDASRNFSQQAKPEAKIPEALAEAALKEAEKVLTPGEYQILLDGLKKGQATKNRILEWLLTALSPEVTREMTQLMYHLSDTCDPKEVHQCVDYLKARMPDRADYAESYRHQMVELSEARLRRSGVKEQSLAELAAQG